MESKKKAAFTRVSQFLFWMTLASGILILGIGIYLKVSKQTSIALFSGRSGEVQQGALNGFSAIFIGIFLLIVALLVRMNNDKTGDGGRKTTHGARHTTHGRRNTGYGVR